MIASWKSQIIARLVRLTPVRLPARLAVSCTCQPSASIWFRSRSALRPVATARGPPGVRSASTSTSAGTCWVRAVVHRSAASTSATDGLGDRFEQVGGSSKVQAGASSKRLTVGEIGLRRPPRTTVTRPWPSTRPSWRGSGRSPAPCARRARRPGVSAGSIARSSANRSSPHEAAARIQLRAALAVVPVRNEDERQAKRAEQVEPRLPVQVVACLVDFVDRECEPPRLRLLLQRRRRPPRPARAAPCTRCQARLPASCRAA